MPTASHVRRIVFDCLKKTSTTSVASFGAISREILLRTTTTQRKQQGNFHTIALVVNPVILKFDKSSQFAKSLTTWPLGSLFVLPEFIKGLMAEFETRNKSKMIYQ
jgi:hypothetical protein